MTDREAGPSYSEEQTRAWLSFLAWGMQQHGQTVFLIEQLQPSWLPSRGQRFVYALGSRIAVSLIFGLALGVVGLRQGWAPVVFALIASAIAGLCAGLIEYSRLPRSNGWQRLEKAGLATRVVVFTAVFSLAGLIGSILTFLVLQPAIKPYGFFLLFGAYWGLRAHRRRLGSDIYTSDILAWSWQAAGKIALPGALIVALVFTVLWRANIGLLMLVSGSIFFFALLATVFAGLQDRTKDMATIPNQGIRLSLKNGLFAAIAGPVIALIELLFLIAIVLAHGEPVDKERSLWFLLLLGLAVGLIAALRYGGLAVVQHYILRFILYRRGYTPRSYVRFLDHAVELRFLQKVGGGYMFVHRYLLEHFAAMEEAEAAT